MGASKSKQIDTPVLTQLEQPTGFSVIITKDGKELPKVENAVSIEDKILQSFNAGKEDGYGTIHRSLDSVAAQVYDNVHEQLVGMQKQQLTKSNELAASIRTSIIRAPVPPKLCTEEESFVISCLKAKNISPRACEDVIESYQKCSLTTLTN